MRARRVVRVFLGLALLGCAGGWLLACSNQKLDPVTGDSCLERPEQAELAVAMADEIQGKGLGSVLLGALAAAAWAAGIERFTAEVLADNMPMRKLMSRSGAKWGVPSDARHSALIEKLNITSETRPEVYAWPLGEAFDPEVRRVHSEDQSRRRPGRGGVIRDAGAVGGTHLAQDGA